MWRSGRENALRQWAQAERKFVAVGTQAMDLGGAASCAAGSVGRLRTSMSRAVETSPAAE